MFRMVLVKYFLSGHEQELISKIHIMKTLFDRFRRIYEKKKKKTLLNIYIFTEQILVFILKPIIIIMIIIIGAHMPYTVDSH